MRGLAGKGVLVTGGSSGIGLATVERFLEEGSRVFMCGIDEGEVSGALVRLGPGRAVAGMACDVSRADDVARLVEEAERFLDHIGILINNAGIARKAWFLDIDAVEWDQTIAVNLRGMFLVGQAVARRIVSQGGGGSIVNMASTNALGGEKEFAHYNASKGGVLQLTRTMAVELGDKGIRVNCVCPGFIDTPLNRALPYVRAVQDPARTPRAARGHCRRVRIPRVRRRILHPRCCDRRGRGPDRDHVKEAACRPARAHQASSHWIGPSCPVLARTGRLHHARFGGDGADRPVSRTIRGAAVRELAHACDGH